MDLNISFRNKMQEDFFWSKARTNVSSGGFGSGKTYVGAQRLAFHSVAFDNYVSVIGRWTYDSLMKTTRQTFYKIIPKNSPLIVRDVEKETEFINGSKIYWLHLDNADENTLRGLEPNSFLIDQAEEIGEALFLVADARVGRWDKAIPSKWLLDQNGGKWPTDEYGKYIVPNYMDLLVNPEDTQHWIYKRFHPDSPTRDTTCGWFHSETDPTMNDPRTLESLKTRDEEWQRKYIKGEWGASRSGIHHINNMSYLEYDEDILRTIIAKGALYRTMDHGETAPTCCLWMAVYKGCYIFYREYYAPNRVISYHRQAIHDLTTDKEHILINWADPAIFHKESQKNGGFWRVADEYLTNDIPGPPIVWTPADNNEYATRNRLNELFSLDANRKHPFTGESPAPGIYFIKRSVGYPNGCEKVIEQTLAQKRVILSTENGKTVYGDERDESVTDHAYDPLRYAIAQHSLGRMEAEPKPQPGSIGHAIEIHKMYKNRNRSGARLR